MRPISTKPRPAINFNGRLTSQPCATVPSSTGERGRADQRRGGGE